MKPEEIVQEQLEAYNAHDVERFVATYGDDVEIFRPPQAAPAIVGKAALREFYATQRFNLPGLHAEIVNRMVLGSKVVDHERITGLRDKPVDAAAVYEISGGLIRSVWLFLGD